MCIIPNGMVEFIDTLGTDAFHSQFAGSPKLLGFLEANFGGDHNVRAREKLLELSDESHFSLRDWIEALRVIRVWLDARGLEMAPEDEIGYVCCAGDAAGAGANLTALPGLVADMLEAYGCERVSKKTVG